MRYFYFRQIVSSIVLNNSVNAQLINNNLITKLNTKFRTGCDDNKFCGQLISFSEAIQWPAIFGKICSQREYNHNFSSGKLYCQSC